MRRTLALAIALFASRSAPARAVDVRSDLTIGREFVFVTNDVDVEVADGQLGLGAGITMVSDYSVERYGAQALVEYRGEQVSAGVAATFGPRQLGRGWASVDPHVGVERAWQRWRLHGDGGVLLRRIDAVARRVLIDLDQLQLHVAADVTLDDRWRAGVFALYSFYGPDPADASLRSLDLGLAVTLAGRPERWAVGGSVARRAASWLWLEVGAAGVEYADRTGNAVVPRVVARLGAWRGVAVAASGEIVVGFATGNASLREIAGLSLEYER
jgi:hypothetical protein